MVEYVAKCCVCQQVKVDHQKLVRPLQPLLIFEWKLKDITINFVSGLPKVKGGNDVIWVIVDCLIKFVLFLPINMIDLVDKLAKLYMDEIIRLHGILMLIVLD